MFAGGEGRKGELENKKAVSSLRGDKKISDHFARGLDK
jgi:hypothetical protein